MKNNKLYTLIAFSILLIASSCGKKQEQQVAPAPPTLPVAIISHKTITGFQLHIKQFF